MQPPTTLAHDQPTAALPDHRQLPDEDGTFVHNFQEHPQSNLLTESMLPRLRERHPDGHFCIGHDCGIYWRSAQPPLDGCKAPDWFYVPGVPPMLDGELRRSYVLWQEVVRPLLVIEFVSGDGSEERDTTPYRGKFWVYEQALCAPYYAIYEVEKGTVELFKLNGGTYHSVVPNEAGRLAVEPLGAELGIWRGTYRGMDLPWLRVWDATTGLLLPTAEEQVEVERQRAQAGKERAETAESLLDDSRRQLEEECERAENERRQAAKERQRAEDEQRNAETERKRAEKLAERLRALGGDPDAP